MRSEWHFRVERWPPLRRALASERERRVSPRDKKNLARRVGKRERMDAAQYSRLAYVHHRAKADAYRTAGDAARARGHERRADLHRSAFGDVGPWVGIGIASLVLGGIGAYDAAKRIRAWKTTADAKRKREVRERNERERMQAIRNEPSAARVEGTPYKPRNLTPEEVDARNERLRRQ